MRQDPTTATIEQPSIQSGRYTYTVNRPYDSLSTAILQHDPFQWLTSYTDTDPDQVRPGESC